MRTLHRLLRLVHNLARRRHVERELDDELRSYRELLVDEKLRMGMSPSEAQRMAAIETGGIGQIKEQVREVRMGFTIDTFSRDARYAARVLVRQPVFSLTVLGLLAIATAGTSAIFSVFNALYLRPLPYADPGRLVNLDETAPQWNLVRTGVAYPDFHAWREGQKAFESMAAFRGTDLQISGDARADRLRGARATHDLLRVLKVSPRLGRWFSPDEDKPGGPKVAVLGYDLWLSRFGGDSRVVGRTIRIDSEPHAVIGVMAKGMEFPNRTEIWLPLGLGQQDDSGWFLQGAGRLKPGVTIAQAAADLLRIHKGMIQAREVNKITSPSVYDLRDWYVGDFRQAATILLGAVGLVLLIACANIAGIMLARGSARTREMGIRTALGAPRLRIARQLFTECLILGALGAALGVAFGHQALRALLALLPPNQFPGWVRFDYDWRFLAFSLTVSIGSAVLFGLWPAWNTSHSDLRQDLHEGSSRSSEAAGRRRGMKILITAEVALAAVLLTAAGLLVQAFRKVERIDPGFRADSVLTYQISPPSSKYTEPQQLAALAGELVSRHNAIPGVRVAAVTSGTPLSGHWGNFFEVEHAPPRRAGDPNPVILQRVVTPGYLEAMGMTLRSGRTFVDTDGRSEGTGAAIVNEMFAKLSWPGQNPIGKRLRRGNSKWWTVVGVIADVKDYGLDRESRPSVYLPFVQSPSSFLAVVMRTSVEPSSLTNAAREALRAIDPDLAMARVITMSERLGNSMWLRRTYSSLIATFAGIAILLVVSGLYGVISYTVSQRRREIAIRVALGAGQRRILSGVLREALLMSGIGLAVGVACGWWSTRFLKPLLFGVEPADPVTYASAIAIVGGVALIASLLPALRASRTQPMAALRID